MRAQGVAQSEDARPVTLGRRATVDALKVLGPGGVWLKGRVGREEGPDTLGAALKGRSMQGSDTRAVQGVERAARMGEQQRDYPSVATNARTMKRGATLSVLGSQLFG